MVQLPDEILEVILCRLPVKDLLRFRCVSKSWLALISSPYFIKLHLNRTVQTKSNLSLFFMRDYYNHFQMNFDSDRFLQPVEIDYFKTRYPNTEISICGSCDGLLCMRTETINNNHVFLWNPSTKKSIQLPSTSDRLNMGWDYRLGYDNINNDYKVVNLTCFKVGKIIDYEINVYSLKSNSWHSPKKFPYRPKLSSIGDSITGGAMHWMSIMGSDSKSKRSIVAFNLGTEKYRVIPLPELGYSNFYLYLNNLEGCLSATCQYSSSTVDIFLLKEYGGKNEHWSKLITISPTISIGVDFPNVEAIAYSKCGRKILFVMDYEWLVWYNLEQNSEEEIRVYGSNVYTYIESMVSLDVQ
ncbi:F-box protein CPR1-like [Impatiens glandulifera]|uniref:F-box protein CPR1-like n=1 Tax=Impatiens glandulifera TaxID=253017 RepID=UPI001FB0F314|nr:F-box protein CPR1-like [Impatiens glandulifera]